MVLEAAMAMTMLELSSFPEVPGFLAKKSKDWFAEDRRSGWPKNCWQIRCVSTKCTLLSHCILIRKQHFALYAATSSTSFESFVLRGGPTSQKELSYRGFYDGLKALHSKVSCTVQMAKHSLQTRQQFWTSSQNISRHSLVPTTWSKTQ